MLRNDVVVHSEVVSSDQRASDSGAESSEGAVTPDLGPLRVVLGLLLAEEVLAGDLLVLFGSGAPLGGQGLVGVVLLDLVASGGQLGGGGVGLGLGLCSESDRGASESNGSGGCSSNGGGAEVTHEV